VEAAIRMTIADAYQSLGGRARDRLAAPHLERAAALRRIHLGPKHVNTLASITTLAEVCTSIGRHTEAIALRQEILDSSAAVLGPDDPVTLSCLSNLARAQFLAGQWNTSVWLLEQALEKQRAKCGLANPATVGTMHWLAINYMNVNRLKESVDLHEKVLKLSSQSDTWARLTLAQACQRAGKFDRADQVLREALGLLRKREVADRIDPEIGFVSLKLKYSTSNAHGWLALNLFLQGRHQEAEPFIRESVGMYKKHLADDFRCYFWTCLLGAVLSGQQRYTEAEPLLLEGYVGMKQRETGSAANERDLINKPVNWIACIIELYDATDRPEKAHLWRQKLPKSKTPNLEKSPGRGERH
jgi:tetratricopeptide (TPR) repeat protein